MGDNIAHFIKRLGNHVKEKKRKKNPKLGCSVQPSEVIPIYNVRSIAFFSWVLASRKLNRNTFLHACERFDSKYSEAISSRPFLRVFWKTIIRFCDMSVGFFFKENLSLVYCNRIYSNKQGV